MKEEEEPEIVFDEKLALSLAELVRKETFSNIDVLLFFCRLRCLFVNANVL